jgi:hypothetical protein
MLRKSSLLVNLIIISLLLTFLHHVDHVFRADHSGWPFSPVVTPFTFSLLIYPLLGVALWAKSRPVLRVVLIGIVALFVTFAHTMIEPPQQAYFTWAINESTDALLFRSRGTSNLLNIQSPLIGFISALISGVGTVVFITTFIISLKQLRSKYAA